MQNTHDLSPSLAGLTMRLITVLMLLWLAGCATTRQPQPEPTLLPPEPATAMPAPPATAPAEQGQPPALLDVLPTRPAGRVPPRMQALEEFAELNDEKLLNVYSGMSRATVERLMDGRQSGSYVNPYKRQVLTGADGKAYEVLFYLTRAPLSGRRVTESQLTPVIFANDRVLAIGRYPLKKLRRAACQAGGGLGCP